MGFVYRVVATLPDAWVQAEYLRWLLEEGHAAAVVAAGAERAEVIEIEADDGALRVATRYVFADRAAYERYVVTTAPTLRAEGVARFVVPYGVTFTRSLGTIRG